MSTIFTSRTAPVKTKEQKKVSILALRVNTASKSRQKSGPVTITKYTAN